MPIEKDFVKVQKNRLPMADVDDFRALTGKNLEAYLDELQEQGGRQQIQYLDDMLDPDMRALIWVRMRDDDTRYRVWDDADELWRAFESDFRRLTTDDIHDMAEVARRNQEEQAPLAARQERMTASQRRDAQREAAG